MSRDATRDKAWSTLFQHLASATEHPLLRDYYSAGLVSAETAIEQVPLVAVDFETTGLNSESDEIVSIGLVPFSSRRIHCRQSRHWVLHPAHPLSEQSVVIHQITHSDIDSAPDLEDILDELLQCLAGKIMVVHYRFIERDFLSQALLRRIGVGIDFPVIDTMALEQQALRENQGFFSRIFRQSLGSVRLADCRKRYNLPAYQSHHALKDALATAELLQAQLAHHYSPSTKIGELWC